MISSSQTRRLVLRLTGNEFELKVGQILRLETRTPCRVRANRVLCITGTEVYCDCLK